MAQETTTVMYDRLDRICFAYYGSVANGEVEAVLNANPGLERHPILLPAGLTIVLPDILPSKTIPVVRPVQLWE